MQQTHSIWATNFPNQRWLSKTDIDNMPVPLNPGVVRSDRGKGDKKPRSQYLEEALLQFPFLIRKDPTTKKYERRRVDVDRLEECFRDREAFGTTWEEWGSAWASQDDIAGGAREHSDKDWWPDEDRHRDAEMKRGKWSNQGSITITELISVKNLQGYLDAAEMEVEQDRRPKAARDLIALALRKGRKRTVQGQEFYELDVVYKQKDVCGSPVGRHYAQGPSIQCLTREARRAAIPKYGNVVDFDLSNSHVAETLEHAKRLGVPTPWIARYVGCKKAWRRAVANYYQVSEELAKQYMLSALNTVDYARLPQEKIINGKKVSPGGKLDVNDRIVCPLVALLKQDCVRVREALLEEERGKKWLKHFHDRKNPERTVFA